jgi:hypothetical protein
MMTPTHVVIGTALLTKPGADSRSWAAIAGSLAPDLSIYAMFALGRLFWGLSDADLWPSPNGLYWQEPWQTLSAVSNSFPLFCGLFALGLLLRREVLWVFAAAALLHLACDFTVHHDDAHIHFWPFSDWRFRSPVSYWDPAYHGDVLSKLELGLSVVLMLWLWWRFTSPRVRIALGAGLASYVAVPAYFSLMLH